MGEVGPSNNGQWSLAIGRECVRPLKIVRMPLEALIWANSCVTTHFVVEV